MRSTDPEAGSSTTDYTYDKADRITGATGATYTVAAVGNMTTAGTSTFGFDQANRVYTATVSSQVSSYRYDGDGKRVSRTVGANPVVSYVYDSNRSLPMVLTDGSLIYVYGLGLAYTVDGAGTLQVLHTDGLGSVRAITDSAGNLIQTFQTDEFGNAGLTQGTNTEPFRFTGQQRDAETGFYNLRARYYWPSLGRFVTRDNFPGSPPSPLSLNRFNYAQGNPVLNGDPSGLVTLGGCVTGVIGIPGAYVTASFCPVTVASNGDVGIQIGVGGGGTTGFIGGVSVGPQVSSGNSVVDLKGPFVTAGSSVRFENGLSLDIFGGSNDQGLPVVGTSFGYTVVGANFTPPFFPGFELHGGVTTTWVASVNVPDLWRKLWDPHPRGNRSLKTG